MELNAGIDGSLSVNKKLATCTIDWHALEWRPPAAHQEWAQQCQHNYGERSSPVHGRLFPLSEWAGVNHLANGSRDKAGKHISVQAFGQKMDRTIHERGVGPADMEAINSPGIIAMDGAESAWIPECRLAWAWSKSRDQESRQLASQLLTRGSRLRKREIELHWNIEDPDSSS
jgi:hypothetical protein